MDFEAREDKDGVRLSWNYLPKSKLQHERNVLPFGAMYTPLNNKSEIVCCEKEQMISCRQCRTFINPYVTLNNDIWICQVCGFSNRINLAQGLPLGLQAENTTIEYKTGRLSHLPPVFLYVVDTCFEGDDLEDSYRSLRDSLSLSLSLLPENALVGFISYGKHVQLYDLTSNSTTIRTFNGNKEYTLEEFQKSMGLISNELKSHKMVEDLQRALGPVGLKFLQTVSMAEYKLSTIIENLSPNTFPHPEMKERPCRATGSAINIASMFLKSVFGEVGTIGGHILCFIGGVCTYGPGKIVGNLLKEPMRSHHDILKSRQTHIPTVNLQSTTKVDLTLIKNSESFYNKVAKGLVTLGISCNFFIGSYDQIGLFEMDEICTKTGGNVVMSDSFNTSVFKQSFVRFFKKDDEELGEGYLDMGFNATLECRTSSDFKIEGLIGNATMLPVKTSDQIINKFISKNVVGEGNTNSWKLCNVNPQSSYAIYFEKWDSIYQFGTIQFLFHYQHPSGEMRLRVTTIPVSIIPDADAANLEYGFDQEAAIVLLARDCVHKMDPGHALGKPYDPTIVNKRLDDFLVKFCSRFAVFYKGSVESFSLSSTYAMLPQFLYHLKRTSLISLFNNSPDETSFIRHVFLHEDVTNSLIIIQPTLLSYDVNTFGSVNEDGLINTEPEPVLLDSISLGPDKILLLDTFFHILIYHGATVAAWRKAGYHEMEGYEHFKSFLEAPKKEAMEILVDRFPLPRFIDCDEGGSQARFLMAKINPSTSYTTNPLKMSGENLSVLTDDISLQVFMDRVKRIVVGNK